jgi:hypothetical protein
MDLYLLSLALGGTGIGVMAAGGLGHHGHSAARGPARGVARGPGANGHAHGHAHGAGHASHGAPGSARAGSGTQQNVHAYDAAGAADGARDSDSGPSALWSLASPRVWFSFLVGLGATGLILRALLGGPFLLAAAIAGGVLFERLLVGPLSNFFFRFASEPALTLESSITDDAKAVSNFDQNGNGLVAIELDGQVVQVLATLRPEERGARVRAGDRVRIESVDEARNRCTVSLGTGVRS